MPPRATPTLARPSLSFLQDRLRIQQDALDDSLMEQPDLYYHVAEAYTEAVAERDAMKLRLEQKTAELDEQFRRQANETGAKITETALQRQLTSTPAIQTLEEDLLRCRVAADKWQALKEAFQQRSFMLRELVAMRISQLSTLSLERSAAGGRADLAQANHDAAAAIRRARRVGEG